MVAPLITLSFWEHCLHSTSGRPYFSNFSAHSLSFLWSLNVEWPGFQSQTPSLLNLQSFFGGLICFMSPNPIYLLRTLKGILPVRTSLILALHVHSCLCCISSWKSDRHLNLKWVESKPWYSLWHLLHPQFFSISVHDNIILAAAQAKNLGVIFDFTISFLTSHLIQQQDLLALRLEYIWILTTSHNRP